MKCMIVGLRSIELGVTNIERATEFYEKAWGLEQVSAEDGTRFFRAGGKEHHVVSIKQTDTPRVLGVTLAAANRTAVDEIHANAGKAGIEIGVQPRILPEAAGGGYGVTLLGAEGLPVTISCDVVFLEARPENHSKPYNLTHVVLNSGDVKKQMAFYCDFLGFRISDSTARMEFIRCGTDHHSIAFAHGEGLSLNHAAFEMKDIDGLMYGAGRMMDFGHEVEWGLGRHGPGSNVFSYFVDPDGFAIEYTTEMQQIEDENYQPKDIQYWSDFPRRPCRWGVARKPSGRLMEAMSGKNQNR
ncbi:MAG TPA: VOC family protein [Herbaspirillum sp.]